MRGKKAKALRRMARYVSQGHPPVRLLQNRETGQVVNDPQSTRGIYRKWKKLTRPGHRVFVDQE